MAPINCPINNWGATDCDGCRQEYEGKCYWFFPNRPISDILTIEERITILEKQPVSTASISPYIPKEKVPKPYQGTVFDTD